jgi:hypothetical protein
MEGTKVTDFDLVAENSWPAVDFCGDCLEIGIKGCTISLENGRLNPRTDMIRD